MKYTKFFAIAAFGGLAFAGACHNKRPASNTSDDLTGLASNVPEEDSVCATDSDCIAVSRAECCPHGVNVAVSQDMADDYNQNVAETLECDPDRVCPLFMILDTRVAQCAGRVSADDGNRHCEMIKIEDIHCGGFVANPHQCPSGYSCQGDPGVVDRPGHCAKAQQPKSDEELCDNSGGQWTDDDPLPDGTYCLCPDGTSWASHTGCVAQPADNPTCLTLTCAEGYRCCPGPIIYPNGHGAASCQPAGSECPI